VAQLNEAVARYHKLFESQGARDLGWAEALQERMREARLVESGRLVAPILRPHFLAKHQQTTLIRAVETFSAALDEIEPIITGSPALMSRLQMLPAEKLLAQIPSGQSRFSITSVMDAHLTNGSVRIGGIRPNMLPAVAYSGALSDLFLDLPILKEFRRGHYRISKMGNPKQLLLAVLKAWKEFGGKTAPRIAILELKQQFSGESTESLLLAELFARGGLCARVLSPDQLEYQNRTLHSGDFDIDIVFRRTSAQQLLVRHDLSHPLLEAYRDRAVCMVNGFRSELAHRLAFFELLTDEAITTKLAAVHRKVLSQMAPWTRVMAHVKTRYRGTTIDLPDFVLNNRERLALRPNEHSSEEPTFVGLETDRRQWGRALQLALQSRYVVQEYSPALTGIFPIYQYGDLQMREMQISVHPHVFAGEVHGASAVLRPASNGVTSPLAIAPVLLLEKI